MSVSPAEVVRRMFDARANGDARRLDELMHPAIEAQALAGDEIACGVVAARRLLAGDAGRGRRVELDARRIEVQADGGVLVHGRVRVFERGSLADSPGAWRVEVDAGRVASITPLAAESRVWQVA